MHPVGAGYLGADPMTRYLVNAVVEVDAWSYVEAETEQDALDQAQSLDASDFETGDALHVSVSNVERDE